MNKQLELTKKFHTAFAIEQQETPNQISQETRQLRINLMQEELQEVIEAMQNEPLENIAKELADLSCALYGTVLAYGIAGKWDEIFGEMIASNMSKLGPDGKPIKRKDGKILKGPNFREAQIQLH